MLAAIGAVGLVTAGVIGNFALLLVSSVLFGGATASNSQSRYAAADLATPAHRARDLSIVVWATTVGSVLGPNLVGPSAPVARWLGLPPLTGPYVFSVIGLLLAIAVVSVRLRPDPLLEARRRRIADGDDSGPAHGSVSRGLRVIAGIPAARLGLLTLALGHVVMVSVMVMTPLHMAHGDAGLELIGLVISIHIVGMFAFSPLTGMAVDRFGGRAVAVVGSVILSTATLLASASPEGGSPTLGLGLFLLGLGWSCTLVAGSTMLTAGGAGHRAPGCAGGLRPGHGAGRRARRGARRGRGGPGQLHRAGPARPRGRRGDRPGRGAQCGAHPPHRRLSPPRPPLDPRSQEQFAESGPYRVLTRELLLTSRIASRADAGCAAVGAGRSAVGRTMLDAPRRLTGGDRPRC